MKRLIAIGLLAADVCLAQTSSVARFARHGASPDTPQSAGAPAPSVDAHRAGIVALQADGVRRAALDYLEGFYEGDTAKLVRVLRPELAKLGFWKEKNSATYTTEKMSYDQAIAYARRFKADKRTTPADAPRDVTIFEVQDQTASAKVRAWWGTDYLLLGKYDGKWMISHILWQGP